MKTKSLPRLLSAVGGIALLFAVMTVPASAQTHATAKLRVAHFSPDTPGVDVYVGDSSSGGLHGQFTVH